MENWAGVKKFAAACGTSIPPSLAQAFDNATRDGKYRRVQVKINQPRGLPPLRPFWRQGYYAPAQ